MFLKKLLASVSFSLLACSSAYALDGDTKQPIYIESNSATFDDNKGLSIYTGDVQVTQGSIRMNSDKMIVYLVDRKPVKIESFGKPVRFKQTPEVGKEDIHAKSMKAVFYPEESRLVLIEKAVVWQGKNTYASEEIQYDSKNAIVKAGEMKSSNKRVKIKLEPGTK